MSRIITYQNIYTRKTADLCEAHKDSLGPCAQIQHGEHEGTCAQCNEMTIAQSIAAKFDNDGTVWETESADLYTECESHCHHPDQCWESESTRYTFDDGSSITMSGPAWDFGRPDCFHFAGDAPELPCAQCA